MQHVRKQTHFFFLNNIVFLLTVGLVVAKYHMRISSFSLMFLMNKINCATLM